MFLNKQILVVLIITALGIVLIAQITLAPSYLLHAQSTSGEGQNTSSGGEEPMFDLYGNIVTAAAAVGGGALGSVLTTRHANKKEYERLDALRKEEVEFEHRMSAIVRNELGAFRGLLQSIIDGGDDKKEQDYLRDMAKNLSFEYKRIPVETRVKIFELDALGKIETAYYIFGFFQQQIGRVYENYFKGDAGFDELKQFAEECAPHVVTGLDAVPDYRTAYG